MQDLIQSPQFWTGVASGCLVGAIVGGLFVAAMQESATNALQAEILNLRATPRTAANDAWGDTTAADASNDDRPRTERRELRSGPR